MAQSFAYDAPNYTARHEQQGATVVVGSGAQLALMDVFASRKLYAAYYVVQTAGTTTGATGVLAVGVIGTATTTVGTIAITTQAATVRGTLVPSTPTSVPAGSRLAMWHTAENTGAGRVVWETAFDPTGSAT